MRQPRPTAIALAAAQVLLLSSGLALAQTSPAPAGDKAADPANTVVVTGRRAALQSAQKIKQDAEEIVDSIVAEEIGKLPDRSITEVLQRIVGVTIDRTMAKGDPEHYSVEGSGVNIRGLSLVRSELNGRDTFSANGGRTLNFEDVPPELMAAVDVYKNPSAKQIEGAIGGLVNLRTALPFDYQGLRVALSVDGTLSKLQGKWSPSVSGLVANRWKTDLGEFGALLSLAHSESRTRSDTVQVEPYFLIDANRDDGVNLRDTWAPRGMAWRTLEFERKRDGLYGALQWKRNTMQSSLTYFESKYRMDWNETASFGQAADPYQFALRPGATVRDGVLQKGTLFSTAGFWGADFGQINFGADSRYANRRSGTKELAWNFAWKPDNRWTLSTDLQLVRSKTQAEDYTVGTGVLMESQTMDLSGAIPRLVYDAGFQSALLNPENNYWGYTMEHLERSKAKSTAWRADATLRFDHPIVEDLSFGVRLTDRDAKTTITPGNYHWAAITQTWHRYWAVDKLAVLSDPRFANGFYTHNFGSGFFGGKLAVPQLLMPLPALAQTGYPAAWQTLHGYGVTACEDKNGAGNCGYMGWSPSSFGTDPKGDNDQSERSQAAYAQLRFRPGRMEAASGRHRGHARGAHQT